MVVVHAGLPAVSDCAMVRKVRVTNGMQELSTEEDSLELRQVGSKQDQRGDLPFWLWESNLHAKYLSH